MTDLMAEQVRLEERMASLGIEKYRENLQKNLQNGTATDSKAVGEAMDYAIIPLAKAIEDFRADAASGKAGRRHSAVKSIEGMDADAVAFIAMKLILDGIVRDQTLTVLALRIGGYIETEQRVRSFAEKNPKVVEMTARKLDGQTSHGAHRRRVLSYMLIQGGDEWSPWSSTQKLALGTKLLELVMTSTGLINIESTRIGRKTIAMVSTTERFDVWLASLNCRAELLMPEYLPCVVPPKDWDKLVGCGYHTDAFSSPLKLVKTRSRKHMRLLEKADLSTVYKAINAIQRTPWAVNKKVLEVAQHFLTMGTGVAGLPTEVEPLPTKPEDIDTNEEARKAWRRQAAMIYESNTSLKSRRIQAHKTLAVAGNFAEYREIYFPYQLDFRGRIYAVASALNPQGTDLSKALLQFADGDPIDSKEAERWFLIHGANCYGIDKVSFSDRVSWVMENASKIVSTAENPFDDLFWADADSPFCFLAWALEYAEYRKSVATGAEFVSRVPIAMDGSCNGLQHYSAMLRDPVAGRAVNLIPSESPKDIYGVVADLVMGKLKEISRTGDEQEAKWAFAWRHVGIDRKITKRPVMVLPYGGTLNSCQKYVSDAVRERGDLPFSDEDVGKATNWLASLVWSSIGETVVSARLAMSWLRQTASAAVRLGRDLSWVTPSGFPVFQFYPVMKDKQIDTVLFGARFQPTITEEVPNSSDRRRQVNGVAPNFVHSLDASVLVLTVCAAVDRGVTKFAMIHDSYGTTASKSPVLSSTLREEFVGMYESYDALEQFGQTVLPNAAEEGVDLPPYVGGLVLSDVLSSDYFFA